MKRIRIGTRGSTLALAQATWVKEQIEVRGDRVVELVIIKTSGDRFIDTPIQSIGGKGVFTKEIEDALLSKEVELAVHSMKDLPTELPAGLAIIAVPKRADPRDVLVSAAGKSLADLPSGARLGTASLRRRAQLLFRRPDLSLLALRGNVDTRLRKLDEGEADGLVMAAAGLIRIGRQERITEYLEDDLCVSAVAQGALGLEAREDSPLREDMAFLHDAMTFSCVSAERAFLARLGGGCHVPVGAHATVRNGRLFLIGVVADTDGKALKRGDCAGSADDGERLGRQLAARLLSEGADKFLKTV